MLWIRITQSFGFRLLTVTCSIEQEVSQDKVFALRLIVHVLVQEERERERLRQRERRLREEERRKIIALNRERRMQLEEARKLKEEAIRLEREKTRLR